MELWFHMPFHLQNIKSLSLKDIVQLARPHQYFKNFFVFLPAFFAFKLHDPETLRHAGEAFLAFSLAASAIYIFNDWKDRHDDRKHPDKCLRPIASGRVGPSQGLLFMLFFLLCAGGVAFCFIPAVLPFIAAYVLLNIAYSLKLKHYPIIDVAFIALGFVLRLFAGAEVTGVALSHWIIVMTFLLALFLAFAKRREDVIILFQTNQQTRKVVDGYSLQFLDASMVMTASIVILAYILWSISPEVTTRLSNSNVYLTAVFVVLGILRYMQIALVEQKGGNPTRVLLKDTFLQFVLAGWTGIFIWILYLK